MDGKYLTFWTDKQLFGVPIAHVVQIVGMQNITEVPEFPYYAKGIINLRGSIIPLI
ncbi:MAG: chemotaxis protein CheW, partial [Oscillospiraceae bacterium]